MKFTIPRTTLLTALSITGKAVDNNNIIISACSMYKFDISKDKLTIAANNMREQIRLNTPCKSDFDGSFLFPAKELIALIKAIPEQPVNFEIQSHIIPATEHQPEQISFSTTIFYSKGKANLPLELGENFPEIKHNSEQVLTISADDLNEGIYRTLYACSNDELRPVFTGVLVEVAKDKLRFSGCDANVLSTFIFDYKSKTEAQIIIPKNCLKLFQDLSLMGEISLSISKTSIQVNFANTEINCLLIDEKVIDYKQIIPVDNNIITCVDKDEILSALSRAAIFCNKFNNLIQMNVTPSSITLKGEDTNYSRDNIEDVSCSGVGDIIIGTNINWLTSSIQRVTTDKFWLSFKAYNKAMVITEYEPIGDSENLMLVMPLWVS